MKEGDGVWDWRFFSPTVALDRAFDFITYTLITSVGYPPVYCYQCKHFYTQTCSIEAYRNSTYFILTHAQPQPLGSTTNTHRSNWKLEMGCSICDLSVLCTLAPTIPGGPEKRPSIGPSLSIRFRTAVRVTYQQLKEKRPKRERNPPPIRGQ